MKKNSYSILFLLLLGVSYAQAMNIMNLGNEIKANKMAHGDIRRPQSSNFSSTLCKEIFGEITEKFDELRNNSELSSQFTFFYLYLLQSIKVTQQSPENTRIGVNLDKVVATIFTFRELLNRYFDDPNIYTIDDENFEQNPYVEKLTNSEWYLPCPSDYEDFFIRLVTNVRINKENISVNLSDLKKFINYFENRIKEITDYKETSREEEDYDQDEVDTTLKPQPKRAIKIPFYKRPVFVTSCVFGGLAIGAGLLYYFLKK